MELLAAAHFLVVNELIELVSARIATLIHNQTTPNIRSILGVQNDLTPEHEARIKDEYRWAEK